MDAGSMKNSSTRKTQTRCPLQEQCIQRRISKENLDRFIPNRSAMDLDSAHYMLTEGTKGKMNSAGNSPSRVAYQKHPAETFKMNRTWILAFKNKPPTSVEAIPNDFSTFQFSPVQTHKARQHIPQTSERTLDAPDLVDDYYLNFLDWG